MAKKNEERKIFSLNRIKFNELYEDALRYIKSTYQAVGQVFSTASPFGQLLQVTLHLGRMIFYYIEDSITGLNIRTAYRPDQIKGLAMLAGHDAGRCISSRGAIRITYYNKGDQTLQGSVCYIPNKTKVTSLINGMPYTILLGAEQGKITMQSGNFLEANIIQGIIKMQYVTGTGEPLQSFNFAERNYQEVDQYYVNVYVNGEPWEQVSSLLDLGFNQKGCIVRTGINGGIDVFFGNGSMGMIPVAGAKIVCEYIVSAGGAANILKNDANSTEYWQIEGNGVLADGTQVKLNDNFRITCISDIIFGTHAEDTALTQLIAPHTSRSFVLANETNYRYFFKKMNMFSDVEIIRGSYNVNGTSVMQLAYDQAEKEYQTALAVYNSILETYGDTSSETKAAYDIMQKKLQVKQYTATKLSDNTYQDNTIYIFLVPDISKRISLAQNYFTCDESLFYLSEEEQENIINLINQTGQRIMTIENKIIQPKVVRFAINVQVKIWDNYDEQTVYSDGLSKLSSYFINYNRTDIIPVSDIVSIFENEVKGVDSVRVWFDADKDNMRIYGNGSYGLDEYGDIILTRTITDTNGQKQKVRDIMPLIRGGFTSPDGIEYSNVQTREGNSAYNLYVTGKSSNRKVNLNNYTALT